MNRNKLFLLENLKECKYSFLDSPILQGNVSEYEVPFATEPTNGEHSLESCENCRKQRLLIIDEVNKKFETFPNCCDYHKKLNDKDFFSKNDFSGIAEMIANKVMFSYHHIINNLENEDWYSDIIAYLNYNIESFGKMPLDCGEPFQLGNYHRYLLHLIKHIEKEIKSEKISLVEVRTRMNKVKKLIDIDREPLVDEGSTDLSLLLTKYDEWFKAFPFDLPYFKHLEQRFKKLIPLRTGRTRYNKYLGATEHEPHTKESLTVFLLQTTQNILTSINGATLYEKGLLNDTEKIAIDLVVQNRKLELLELSKMPNTKKTDYIKVLKRWFKEEKNFIKDITPLLKELPPGQANFNNSSEKPQPEPKNNDFIKSTIEDYLEPLNKYFNTDDYDLLINELDTYFKTGVFTNSTQIIKTINRPNVKLIGSTLKEIYNSCFNDNRKLSIEYLRFGKQRISVFKNVPFDENNYFKSNLYKYYNTKVSNT